MNVKKVSAAISGAIGAVTLIGIVIAGILYLAGQFTAIETLNEGLDLTIEEGKVDRARDDVQRIESRIKFQPRSTDPAVAELEMLDIERERLQERQEALRQKEEFYQQRRAK